MIDTIVLTLTSDLYQITDPDKFDPPTSWIKKSNFHIKSIQNPTAKELRTGIYKPRLTIANRINKHHRADLMLKIELSLPKLIFGNNFQELSQKDFPTIVDKLVATLAGMGIATTHEIISQAPVSAIHYSKNIALTDGMIPYHLLNKLKEANIELTLDVNQTDYRNDGHSYRWHCNAYEVVFYDKIRDLEQAYKSDKRALEKDNEIQLHIFDELQHRHKFEILRMEVRLNKRVKIKQLLAILGIKKELSFKNLFKSSISKKILLHYLDKLEQKRPLLLDYKTANDKALLNDLIFHNPQKGPRQILALFGLKKVFESINPRELRTIFSGYHARSWARLIADAHSIELPLTYSPFGVIRKQLMAFKTLKLTK